MTNQKTLYKLQQLYTNLVKHVSYNGIIKSTQTGVRDDDGKRKFKYILDNELIKSCLKSEKYKNIYCNNFKDNNKQQFNVITIKRQEQHEYLFLDDGVDTTKHSNEQHHKEKNNR